MIYFKLQGDDVNVSSKSKQDMKAVLTAELIHEVFNIRNTGMRIYKSDIRFHELNKEMNIMFDNLEELKSKPESKVVLRKLKAILRRESKFAAFKRAYVRDNSDQFPELLQYIV